MASFEKAWQCFFERRGIGVMTDGGHHGEGEHDQRYVPMPAMPGAALIVIEAEFVLGGLEAVFDGPATAFHRDQFFRGRALGAPCGEERHSTIGNVAADQQPSRPLPRECAVVLRDIEVGEFEIGPVVQAWTLGPFTGRQTPPGALGKALCDLGGTAALGARQHRGLRRL